MFWSRDYLYNLVTGKIKGPLAVSLRGFLFILSLVYGLSVVILAGFYRIRPVRFGARVISVGNITLGGTGKTTFVEYLGIKLNSLGKKIAILSRGYKRNSKLKGVGGIGDEPAMLEKKLLFANIRVVVDKNRVTSALKAIRDYAVDTLILDDGLQQWRISKDLEIVTIDVSDPFGNYHMLPAGFLREPISALKRADVFVLTGSGFGQDISELVVKLERINSRALIVESMHQPMGFVSLDAPDKLLSLDLLKDKSAIVFSGIGNPLGFENSISALGIKIDRSIRFTDHYEYTYSDLDNIIKEAKKKNLEAIITTQKDAVKIRELKIESSLILVLDIKLSIIKNEAEFDRRLLKLYSL